MSFGAKVYGCVKVSVTTIAQDVPDPDPSQSHTAVAIVNAGPSIIFVERNFTSQPSPAVVDQSMPIMPGTQVSIPSGGSNFSHSVVSEGSATAYVTFGGGEINGVIA